MNIRTLQTAIAKAERFLDLARELQAEGDGASGYFQGTRALGATLRASMDLTLALSDLRRSI
jgi:hypothetical protein